jgi:hypothetical protein
MITILIIIAALGVGWFARAHSCSPSCRGATYVWTPELEEAAYARGRGAGRMEERRGLAEMQASSSDDESALQMLGGAHIGLGVEVILPSGRAMDGDEAQALTGYYGPPAPDRS